MDTAVTIKNGKLITDLYKKPTDRCQYLLPSSCHPAHIPQNIPFSLCYRLVRICSEPHALEKKFKELRSLLISRDYRPKVIDSAIEKAKKLDRNEALKRVPKKKNYRVVFVLDFNPCLPSIPKIVQSAWRVMTQDPLMQKVFAEPMMVAFRRPSI